MTLPANEKIMANSQILLTQFQQVIHELINIFAEENELIRTFALNEENQTYNSSLIELKRQKADHLQFILAQIFEARDLGMLDASQIVIVKSTYGIFFKKLEENLAYLQLAETLNHKILSFFIDANNELSSYSYKADGSEKEPLKTQAASFLYECV